MLWGTVAAPAKPHGAPGTVSQWVYSHHPTLIMLSPSAWFLTFHLWHKMGPALLIRGIKNLPPLPAPIMFKHLQWLYAGWSRGSQGGSMGPRLSKVASPQLCLQSRTGTAASPLEGSGRPLAPCHALPRAPAHCNGVILLSKT